MRRAFLLIIACFPVIVQAQQKGATEQEQLKRELDALKMEMQSKIQSLQDSIVSLQKELEERQGFMPGTPRMFRYSVPEWEGDDLQVIPLDSLLHDYSWKYSYRFPQQPYFELEIPSMPEIPEFDYHLMIPDKTQPLMQPYKYKYRYKIPGDFYHEKKDKGSDFWRMMPFYEWFKS